VSSPESWTHPPSFKPLQIHPPPCDASDLHPASTRTPALKCNEGSRINTHRRDPVIPTPIRYHVERLARAEQKVRHPISRSRSAAKKPPGSRRARQGWPSDKPKRKRPNAKWPHGVGAARGGCVMLVSPSQRVLTYNKNLFDAFDTHSEPLSVCTRSSYASTIQRSGHSRAPSTSFVLSFASRPAPRRARHSKSLQSDSLTV